MIKLRDIINEAKWSDRKWGDPLPTLEDVMKEADDDDAYVHVGGGTYKEKNRATGKPLPNSPSYIKKDSGGYEMVDDDDPRLSKDDDDKGDEEKPSGGDLDYSRDGEESDDEEGEPDFYDPEDYEKHYPEKTKPKDEVGGVKYGQGFSADSDHMFDSVADSKRFTYDDEHSSTPTEDKYSGMLDAVKGGDWEKFRAGIHDIEDQDAREHLLNLANHVDSGTYKGEFPSGKKGEKFGRKEVMDLFKQAADYGHEQGSGDNEEKPSGEEPEDDGPPFDDPESDDNWWKEGGKDPIDDEKLESWIVVVNNNIEYFKEKGDDEAAAENEESKAQYQRELDRRKEKGGADEKEETIKVINGKKYKAIKEAKKPTLLYESKMEIRKMWERIKQN